MVLKQKGKEVFAVDFMTLQLIEGGTIDFTSSMIRSAFEVSTNPNADSSCSCKVSFSPKETVLEKL